MEFQEKDYILGVWYLENDKGNFMMSVLKRDNKWLLEYRFRYYEDTKIFGSKDKKNWYCGTMPGTIPENIMLEKTNEVFNEFKTVYKATKSDIVLIQSDDIQVFMYKMAQMDWMHVRKINTKEATKEELEEVGLFPENIKQRRK